MSDPCKDLAKSIVIAMALNRPMPEIPVRGCPSDLATPGNGSENLPLITAIGRIIRGEQGESDLIPFLRDWGLTGEARSYIYEPFRIAALTLYRLHATAGTRVQIDKFLDRLYRTMLLGAVNHVPRSVYVATPRGYDNAPAEWRGYHGLVVCNAAPRSLTRDAWWFEASHLHAMVSDYAWADWTPRTGTLDGHIEDSGTNWPLMAWNEGLATRTPSAVGDSFFLPKNRHKMIGSNLLEKRNAPGATTTWIYGTDGLVTVTSKTTNNVTDDKSGLLAVGVNTKTSRATLIAEHYPGDPRIQGFAKIDDAAITTTPSGSVYPLRELVGDPLTFVQWSPNGWRYGSFSDLLTDSPGDGQGGEPDHVDDTPPSPDPGHPADGAGGGTLPRGFRQIMVGHTIADLNQQLRAQASEWRALGSPLIDAPNGSVGAWIEKI